MAWPRDIGPGGAIEIGCAEAVAPANNPTNTIATIERTDALFRLRMILSENRFPLFGIMRRHLTCAVQIETNTDW